MNILGTLETIRETDFVSKCCTLNKNSMKLQKIFEVLKLKKIPLFFVDYEINFPEHAVWNWVSNIYFAHFSPKVFNQNFMTRFLL